MELLLGYGVAAVSGGLLMARVLLIIALLVIFSLIGGLIYTLFRYK